MKDRDALCLNERVALLQGGCGQVRLRNEAQRPSRATTHSSD